MTRRFAKLLMAIGLFLGAGLGQVAAQPAQFRPARPAVSPYLNLTRPGADIGLNYFNLVRPQVYTNSALQQLQQQTQLNRYEIDQVQQSGTPTTGKATSFMNLGGYFMTNMGGQSGSLGRRPATTPTTPTAPTAPPRPPSRRGGR